MLPLTKPSLAKLKSRAVRKGIWYEVLTRTERAIFDLTIKCVEKVRSPTLAKTIVRIIGKIKTLGKSFMEKAQEIGDSIAKQTVEITQKWGNKESSKWINDTDFIKFLGVMALNT